MHVFGENAPISEKVRGRSTLQADREVNISGGREVQTSRKRMSERAEVCREGKNQSWKVWKLTERQSETGNPFLRI